MFFLLSYAGDSNWNFLLTSKFLKTENLTYCIVSKMLIRNELIKIRLKWTPNEVIF